MTNEDLITTTSNQEIIYKTSSRKPEGLIPIGTWGASPLKGLLPFQLKHVSAKPCNTEVDISIPQRMLPRKPQHSSYASLVDLEGLEHSKIQAHNKFHLSKEELAALNPNFKMHGWGLSLKNSYFYPNPIETKMDWGNKRPHRVSISKPEVYAVDDTGNFLETSESEKDKLAAIFFFYVDIDNFSGPIHELVESVSEHPTISPQVIIRSGAGVHLYFAITPIYLLPIGRAGCSVREEWQNRFRTIQLALCKVFDGDISVAKNICGVLRVPGTNNYKIKNNQLSVRICKEIKGSLIDAYHSPRFTIEEIESRLGIAQEDWQLDPPPEALLSAPPPSFTRIIKERKPISLELEDWEECYERFQAHFRIRRDCQLKLAIKKYFIHLYGTRKMLYYVEARDGNNNFVTIVNGSALSLKGKTLKRVRNLFIDEYRVITCIKQSNPDCAIAARYQLTEDFYLSSGATRIENEGAANIQKFVEEISLRNYPPNELRDLLPGDYRSLRNMGIDERETREIIEKMILDRLCPTGDEEALLDWCEKDFQEL